MKAKELARKTQIEFRYFIDDGPEVIDTWLSIGVVAQQIYFCVWRRGDDPWQVSAVQVTGPIKGNGRFRTLAVSHYLPKELAEIVAGAVEEVRNGSH